MTSHNFDDISEVCNELLFLDQGKIIFSGSLNEFYDKYSGSRILKIKLKNKNDSFYQSLINNIDQSNIEIDESSNEYSIRVENDIFLDIIHKTMESYMYEIVDISIQNIELKDIVREMFP